MPTLIVESESKIAATEVAAPILIAGPAKASQDWIAPWKRVFINGVRIDAVTEQQCVDAILDGVDRGDGGCVVTHNLDHMRRLDRDEQFAAVCAGADLRVADGMPLVWITKIMRNGVPERVAGSSLIYTLSEGASLRGKSIYLLGGDEGTADAASAKLVELYPKLKIAGQYCVPFGFEKNPAEMTVIRQKLLDANPDIVFVALGSPKQEFLIGVVRDTLPKAWWLGVGISFSYVCGQVVRAPKWVQTMGCEWLYRMAQEPGRLFKRYVIEGIPFAMSLLYRHFKDSRSS